MEKLKTGYIDLMLLHQPFGDYYGAWRALEELYEAGKLRAIGISNFYPDRMVDMASFSRIKPMVNQIEIHPHNQQETAKQWNEKYGLQLEAWAPFGEGRGGMFELPELKTIGEKYGKTSAQVILRWHLQRGIVVIPKSTHITRMEENLQVFDFELTADEMAQIANLDKKESSFFSLQLEAWAPFGEGRGGMFELPELKTIGEKYGKTSAQVILRWHLQRGIVVIPKSTHITRMEENLQVFDFELTADEMAQIANLDKKESSFFSHYDPAMVEWFVKMVEERKKQNNCKEEKKNW